VLTAAFINISLHANIVDTTKVSMKFVFKENVLRVALIAASLIFSILSLALIALAVVYYRDLTPINLYIVDDNFFYLPAVLIVLGILSFISSIFGCYFVKNRNKTLIKLLVVLLTLLLAIELMISSIAFMNLNEEFTNSTMHIMKEQFSKNATDHFSELEDRVS